MSIFSRFFKPKTETRDDPSWQHITPQSHYSGIVGDINPRLAENLSTVHAAVELITNALATLPPKIYKHDGTTRMHATDHALNYLLRKPNKYSSWPEFIRNLIADVLLYGNGIAIWRDNSLHWVPYRQVIIEQLRSGKLRYSYTPLVVTGGSNQHYQRVAMEDRVLHIRDRGDSLVGVPRLARCSATVNLALAIQEGAYALWQNGCFPSGAFTSKSRLDTKQRQHLQDSLQQKFAGSGNRARVLVLDGDMTYQPIEISPEKLDFVEQRKFMVREIARVFNLSPILLGDLDNASYSNTAQAARYLAKFTLQYWTRLFESTFSDLLLADDEQLELDLSIFTRGDTAERWNAYKIALEQGVLTSDDVRRLEGY